jgi:hypothetical protein
MTFRVFAADRTLVPFIDVHGMKLQLTEIYVEQSVLQNGLSARKEHIGVAVGQYKVEALCSLKRDLIEAGVPEDRIGLLHSYEYDEAKAKAFLEEGENRYPFSIWGQGKALYTEQGKEGSMMADSFAGEKAYQCCLT